MAAVHAILERPPSRWHLARRRARRLGWPTVVGQALFVTVVMPGLGLVGRRRVRQIQQSQGLDVSPIDATPLDVRSVNDQATLHALHRLAPALVVVHGTRIISGAVLGGIDAPVLNLHAGITPRYRGVHGGYWALAEGRPELAGTTLHLVDEGIDTGGIVAQATFDVTRQDSIATYPTLHVACGLPLVVEAARAVLGGGAPEVVPPLVGAEESQLRWHPTVWGYLATRIRNGVR
jgi:folate-dependent phosphoribosylglycinamide formyltransferase PurN